MLFWIICVLLTAVVGAMVAAPLWRTTKVLASSPDVAFYKSQLEELDRDITREVISSSDATVARVEIARRLLTSDDESTVQQIARS